MFYADFNPKYVKSVWIKWFNGMKISKNVTVDALGVQVFSGGNSKRNWIPCKNDSSYLKIFELKKWANSEFWHVIDISR